MFVRASVRSKFVYKLSIFIFLAQIFKLTSCELQAVSQQSFSSQSVSQQSVSSQSAVNYQSVIQLVIILSEPIIRGVARYFFVKSILMMASFHTFTSEVCEKILLGVIFKILSLLWHFRGKFEKKIITIQVRKTGKQKIL